MPEAIDQVYKHLDVDDRQLVALHEISGPWKLDIRYATSYNITGKPIYPFAGCLLRAGTARKLLNAAEEISRQKALLIIWDGYRPPEAQQQLWEAVPDPTFVAPPETGSKHSRGVAVDVTLADSRGILLDMPTGFDDFTEQAAASYSGLLPEVESRRALLQKAMVSNGFQMLESEWWHFEDTEWQKYELLNADFTTLQSLINR